MVDDAVTVIFGGDCKKRARKRRLKFFCLNPDTRLDYILFWLLMDFKQNIT
jgi:hypothetical protein